MIENARDTVVLIKAAKAVVVITLVVVATIKRKKSRKKRFAEIKSHLDSGGQLPDSKFYVTNNWLMAFADSKKKKNKAIRNIIGTDDKPYIEIKDNGLNFSVLFMGNTNYKNIVKYGRNYLFIPWQDMTSIKVTNLEPVRFAGTRERYSEKSISLLIKIKRPSNSQFIGKKVYVNLSLIDDQNGFQFLLKHNAKELFKQKI